MKKMIIDRRAVTKLALTSGVSAVAAMAAASAIAPTFGSTVGDKAKNNKAAMKRIIEAYNAGADKKVWEKLLRPKVVNHTAIVPDWAKGVENWVTEQNYIRSVWPDFKFVAEDMIAEGDWVIVRGTSSGTMKADFGQAFPATGKPGSFTNWLTWRFEGGKGIDRWGLADWFGYMVQQGFWPPKK